MFFLLIVKANIGPFLSNRMKANRNFCFDIDYINAWLACKQCVVCLGPA